MSVIQVYVFHVVLLCILHNVTISFQLCVLETQSGIMALFHIS